MALTASVVTEADELERFSWSRYTAVKFKINSGVCLQVQQRWEKLTA